MLKKFFINNIIKSFILIFLILFIAVNKISKRFLDQYNFETRTMPNYLEKVYGKENIEDYQTVISEQSGMLDYKPFVEFAEKKKLGKFTSVSDFGNRCNRNSISKCELPKGGKKEIWMFGGSTTFGYGVKNDETIAASIERHLNGDYRVINFGAGYYFSTQERILFNNLLLEFPAPHSVIFLDGVNDFYRSYAYNQTFYSNNIKYKMSKTSGDDLRDYFKERYYRLNIVRLINEFKFKKQKININKSLDDKKISELVNVLINNQKINQSTGQNYNIKILNILQPAPIFDDSYSTSKVIQEFKQNDKIAKVKLGYELYLTQKDDSVLNLSELMIKEPMYVDTFHYTPKFNDVMANIAIMKLELKNAN
tara:strand:- start:1345 stop:2442 length:1098 start_codon:yes stop_codon:yes gene_type:complete